MFFEVSNIEYNLIKKKLLNLEIFYKQSCDDKVRKSAKENVFFDLCMSIEGFYETFWKQFEACQMESLRQIDDLSESVLVFIKVRKMPQLDLSTARKILKLKEKPLINFVKSFNEAAEAGNLTYYSQKIDEKMIFIYFKDGKHVGVVSEISRDNGIRQSLCHFCNNFRTSDEIVFVSNSTKTSNGGYSALGQYCCLNQDKCNSDILDEENLSSFMTYGNDRIKKR